MTHSKLFRQRVIKDTLRHLADFAYYEEPDPQDLHYENDQEARQAVIEIVIDALEDAGYRIFRR